MAIVEAVGLGLAAGVVGTIALTIAETVEMRITGRESSTIPGQVDETSRHDRTGLRAATRAASVPA